MELALAKKEKGVVMTECSGESIPAATRASQRASVPLAQPMPNGAEQAAAAACSKEVTSGPRMKRWETQTRSTASMTSSRMRANWREKSRKGTGWKVAGAIRRWTAENTG